MWKEIYSIETNIFDIDGQMCQPCDEPSLLQGLSQYQ